MNLLNGTETDRTVIVAQATVNARAQGRRACKDDPPLHWRPPLCSFFVYLFVDINNIRYFAFTRGQIALRGASRVAPANARTGHNDGERSPFQALQNLPQGASDLQRDVFGYSFNPPTVSRGAEICPAESSFADVGLPETRGRLR